MKRSILHICILLSAVFLCNTKMLAWGENVSYLLNSTTEYSMSTSISDFGGRAGETFAFDAPMARVEFEAKKSALSVSGFYVQISTDGNVWSDLSGCLVQNLRQVRFHPCAFAVSVRDLVSRSVLILTS